MKVEGYRSEVKAMKDFSFSLLPLACFLPSAFD
jgi:hypothetical protein